MSDFSFEEAVGTPAGKPPAGDGRFTFEEAGGKVEPKTDGETRLGGVKAAGKAVGAEVAGLGDMFLGMPGAAIGSGSELIHRIIGKFDPELSGVSNKAKAMAGATSREEITANLSPTWFSDIVTKIAGEDGEPAGPTHVAKAMEGLQKALGKAGSNVEKLTAGKYTKEDFEGLGNMVMNFAGAKGGAEGLVKGAKGLASKFTAEKPKAPEATYTPPEAAIDPVSRAKQDIEKTTGIAEQEERASYRKQRMKEAASAFKDDAKFTAYAREHAAAEAEAFAASLPKIDPDMAGKADPELLAAVGLGVGGTLAASRLSEEQLDNLATLGFAGIFFGEKGAHLEATRKSANVANKMLDSGVAQDKVRLATGWFVGKYDNKWRNELSDHASDLTPAWDKLEESKIFGETHTTKLADILHHPELFEHYPELKDVTVVKRKGFMDIFGGLQGWFNPDKNELGITPYAKDPLSTILHEVQHWIQEKEGFATGGNENMVFEAMTPKQKGELAKGIVSKLEERIEGEARRIPQYNKALEIYDVPAVVRLREHFMSERPTDPEAKKEFYRKLDTLEKEAYRAFGAEYYSDLPEAIQDGGLYYAKATTRDEIARYKIGAEKSVVEKQKELAGVRSGDEAALKAAIASSGEGHTLYRKLSGEIEARDTQARQNLTPKGRLETEPFSSENIAPEDAITTFGTKGPSSESLSKRGQLGGATFDTMKGIAAVSLGLAVGTALDKDNAIEGAILGVMGGVALSSGAVPKAFKSLRELAKPDPRVRVNNLTNEHEYQIAAAARDVWQVQQRIIELVPKQADREAIHRAIDAGKVGELKGPQAAAAKIAQEFYEKIGAAAQDVNVLKETRDDYTTHLWKTADKAKLNELLSKKAGTPFSPSSRFAQGRLHVTLEEGKAAGLRPLTEDIAEVIGLYGNSLSRSIANRKLLDGLKVAKGPEGRLALPDKVAPASFVKIDTPSIGGWKVHPDIAPSLKFVMEAKDPGAIVNGLLALNTALKRNVVSFSLFHAKALLDAALGALNNPGTAIKVVAQAAAPKVFGKNRYLKQLRDGGAGDLVDHALKSGLKFSYERGTPAVEDVGGGFYEGMRSLQEAMDKTIPYSGKATVGAYTRVNHAFDNFMWGRLHSAMKLETFAAKVEALMENSAKAGKPLTKEKAGEIAARYTNDVFGGLNWRRMAEGAKTKWGRDLSLAMLSPKGRMGLQLLMFAPDWTLSTSRAFVKAFGKGSGLKGIVSATAEADLYRQQLLRSAFYYVAIGDTLNYANSGHHLWDNKDPFRVDLGDGRTMQLSKHFTEPFEWLQKSRQTAINKMGQLPKEGIEQLMQVDRLQASGKMQPMQNPGRHLAGNIVPFAAQPAVQGEPNAMQRAVASTFGTPIYGHTPEERRQIRFQKAEERYKQHMQELDKLTGGKK